MSKFGGSELAERLYYDALDGFTDDELGVSEFGWYGLFEYDNAILLEDSQGFVSATAYETRDETLNAWAVLQDDYRQWLDTEYPSNYGCTNSTERTEHIACPGMVPLFPLVFRFRERVAEVTGRSIRPVRASLPVSSETRGASLTGTQMRVTRVGSTTAVFAA